MLERLDYEREGSTPAQVRAEFDNGLGVRVWWRDGTVERPVDDLPEGAPAWWLGDEDASSTFLDSMGVIL